MQRDIQTRPVSKRALWGGRIISWLPALFLLVDGVMKLFKPAPVVEATVKLGYPGGLVRLLLRFHFTQGLQLARCGGTEAVFGNSFNNRFDQSIPCRAMRALPLPFWCLTAAFGADID